MNVQDIGDTFKICAYHMHTVYALSFSRLTFTAHVPQEDLQLSKQARGEGLTFQHIYE